MELSVLGIGMCMTMAYMRTFSLLTRIDCGWTGGSLRDSMALTSDSVSDGMIHGLVLGIAVGIHLGMVDIMAVIGAATGVVTGVAITMATGDITTDGAATIMVRVTIITTDVENCMDVLIATVMSQQVTEVITDLHRMYVRLAIAEAVRVDEL